jgi:hypothetical protein
MGGMAQLVERLLCTQDVSGSSPLTSMNKQSVLILPLPPSFAMCFCQQQSTLLNSVQPEP